MCFAIRSCQCILLSFLQFISYITFPQLINSYCRWRKCYRFLNVVDGALDNDVVVVLPHELLEDQLYVVGCVGRLESIRQHQQGPNQQHREAHGHKHGILKNLIHLHKYNLVSVSEVVCLLYCYHSF